jgi:hypothetical protein
MNTLTRLVAVAGLAASCLAPAALAQDTYNMTTLVSGVSSPVGVAFAPGDNSRMFIVEQGGRIRIATLGGTFAAPTATLLATPFLDLAALDTANPFFRNTSGTPLSDQSGTVVPRLIRNGGAGVTNPSTGNVHAVVRGNEQGLLGLAFAPDFATSRKFYINYTQNNPNMTTGAITWSFSGNGVTTAFQASTNGRTVIKEYTVDPANPNAILPGSERLIIAIPQTFTNHNGGCIRFGPDGMLWIGMGDGGSGNDPNNDALDPNDRLGKMIRIDVSGDDFPADAMRNYRIPTGNAYPNGVGGLPEIWARGLRNPWRFTFDSWTGDLWIGDVGQNAWEEISRVPSTATGLNFGWRVREGLASTGLSAGGFDVSNLTPPIYVYPRQATNNATGVWSSAQDGISTCGGLVYRGNIRGLRGLYLFTDTYAPTFWAFPANVQPTATGWRGEPSQVGLLEISSNLRNQTVPAIPQQTALGNVVSIDEDNQGEVYITEINGRIRKIIPAGVQPAIANVAGANQSTTPDNDWTADDIIVYLGWYFANDPRADVAGPNQSTFVDQALTADDIIVFLGAYFDLR